MTSRNQKDKKQEGGVFHTESTGMRDGLAGHRNRKVLRMVTAKGGGGRRMESWAEEPHALSRGVRVHLENKSHQGL